MTADLIQLAQHGDWKRLQAELAGKAQPVDLLSKILPLAVVYENLELSQFLLEAGADPNHIPSEIEEQIPAIFAAALTMTEPTVMILLAHGADINLHDLTGCTPLMLAVDIVADSSYQNNVPPTLDYLHFLLAQGADPTLRNHKGETAADVARIYGWEEAVKLLSDSEHYHNSDRGLS